MTKFYKHLTIAAMIVCALSLALPLAPVLAADDPLGFGYANNLGLDNSDVRDPREIAVNIVRFLMTFLGIIAVVIILYGGFLWMTAAGNDDQVGKAKSVIIAGAIGLAVILAAFIIVNFVVETTSGLINGDIGGMYQ